MYYGIIIGVSILIFGLFFYLKKILKINSLLVDKISSAVLLVLFFVWFLLSKGNSLVDVSSLVNKSPFATVDTILSIKAITLLTLLAVWANIIIHSLFSLAPFFNFRIVKYLYKFVTPILLLFTIILSPQIIFTYSDSFGFTAIGLLFAIETGIMLAIQVYYLVFTDHEFKIEKGDIKEFVAAIVVVILFSMPHYVPLALFGYPQIPGSVLAFDFSHRIYLYSMFLYLIFLTLLLRNRKGEYSRMVLLFIANVAMINFTLGRGFPDFIHPWDWPLHICNAAMYILPIALASKNEKVFYFTFFINILGAMFATFMPDYDPATLFTNEVTYFWMNHIEAAMMPMVCVLLGVFNRPTKKQFFWSMVGFLGYYILVLIMNPLLTGIQPVIFQKYGIYYDPDGIDFFFINSDFIASKIHAEFILEDFKFEFDVGGCHFVLYPLYQALYFLGFVAFSVGMWFVYVYIFKAQDALMKVHAGYKKVKFDELALCAKYNKKEVSECMSELSKDKLVISHFSKRYGDKAPFAVKDINFEAKAGEIVGFLGPNGAGKSTTIKAIVGIHLPTEGTIEVNGYDVVSQSVEAKAQLGFVPDHYALYENLTGREYLNYIADLYKVSKEDRDAFLDEFLDTLSMRNSIDSKMQTYSHGMKQKIAIMASIIHNPKLWILDEPLTGLDPVSIYQVKQCLKKHAEKGNIVFFSSHLIDIVEKLCDRIVIISDHKVQDIADVHELTKKGVNLEQYYMEKAGQISGD